MMNLEIYVMNVRRNMDTDGHRNPIFTYTRISI